MIQRERDGRRRGVAVLIHGHHHFVHGQLEFSGRALHDADVGLVRDQPVDIGLGQISLSKHCASSVFQHTHRQLKHRLAVHLEHRITQHCAT